MSSQIKVSVIVPAYNASKYIHQCLESIINQDFDGEIEILISYFHSEDGTDEIIAEYANRYSFIRPIKNQVKSPAYERFHAISEARGKYLYFVDADDFISPHAIQHLYKMIESKNADIVNCNFYVFDNKQGVEHIEKNSFSIEGSFGKYKSISLLQKDSKIRSFFWTKMWRKTLFDEIPENIKFEDWDGIFEDGFPCFYLFYKSSVVFSSKETLYYYRKGNISSASTTSNKNRLSNHIAMFALERYFIDKTRDTKLFKVFRKMIYRYRWSLYFDAYISRKIPDFHFWKQIKSINKFLRLIKSKHRFNIREEFFEFQIRNIIKDMD